MSPITDEVNAVEPDQDRLDILLELVQGLHDRQDQLERTLKGLQGSLGAIRAFMHSHNTALGELGQRFDRLACMTEPCEPQGNGQAEGSRKTPSTELKPI